MPFSNEYNELNSAVSVLYIHTHFVLLTVQLVGMVGQTSCLTLVQPQKQGQNHWYDRCCLSRAAAVKRLVTLGF